MITPIGRRSDRVPRRAENGQTVSTDQVFTGLPTGRVVPLCRWCADHEARTSQPVSRVAATVSHMRDMSTAIAEKMVLRASIGRNNLPFSERQNTVFKQVNRCFFGKTKSNTLVGVMN